MMFVKCTTCFPRDKTDCFQERSQYPPRIPRILQPQHRNHVACYSCTLDWRCDRRTDVWQGDRSDRATVCFVLGSCNDFGFGRPPNCCTKYRHVCYWSDFGWLWNFSFNSHWPNIPGGNAAISVESLGVGCLERLLLRRSVLSHQDLTECF